LSFVFGLFFGLIRKKEKGYKTFNQGYYVSNSSSVYSLF
jgi:hypothetical protein